MSEDTGDPGAPGAGAGGTPEHVPESAPVPAESSATTTTVEPANGSGRPGWLTALLAGIAVLVLLGAGFGIGRWTDGGGGDHRFRFSDGRGVPGGRDGRGFAGPGNGSGNGNGFNGPRFGPGFGGSGNGFNGPGFNGPGFNGPGFNGPGHNGRGFGNRGDGNGPNGNTNGSTTTTQPSSL
jgi:hypothetical protein